MHTPITAQAERVRRFAALLGLEVWLRHRAGEQDREVACCLNNAPLCEAIEVCQATSAAIFQLLFLRASKRLCASHLRRYNAEAIYAQPGCDAIFVGPVDLRFQMRAPDGTFPTEEAHEALLRRVIATGRKVGTPTGMHVLDPASARQRAEEGMQFIAVGSDLRFMSQQALQTLSDLHPGCDVRAGVTY